MPGRQKQSAPADRTLPHNLEAERSILGAILLHNAAYEKVSERLGPEDFFRDAHRRIYDAVERLLEWPGGMVDLVTLKETLNKRGELEEVGGPAYITALTDGVPRGSNIVHYADVVKEKALLRGLIYAAGKMLERAYQAEEPPHVLLAEADKLIIDLQAGRGAGKMAPLSASASALFENLEYRVQHRGELSGVDTGFKSINEQTQGWQAGDYIVLGARPSIGKTTFAINTMVAGARAGARVACFSMEMTRQQLEYRILARWPRSH
jgi:replicative DNA helicase